MSFNNFKSTTIRGSFNNSDHADGSVLASATFQRGLTSSELITTNGLLNTTYNSIFGTSPFNVLQTHSGGYFYAGSFSQIQVVNLPLNPIIGTTYTFYNAGTFTVLIQCAITNGFESNGQIIQTGLSPPGCILYHGANLTLYFRGTWVCIAGFSFLAARLNLENTFPLPQTFNNININGVLSLPNNSILDRHLSSNVVLNTNLTTTLTNYVTSQALSNFNYLTTASLSNYALVSSLSNYALVSSLSNYALVSSLSNYVLNTNLTASLTNYVLNTNLTASLTNYVLNNNLTSTLLNYVTSQALSDFNYLTTASLSNFVNITLDQSIGGIKRFLARTESPLINVYSTSNNVNRIILNGNTGVIKTSFIEIESSGISSVNQIGFTQITDDWPFNNAFSPLNQYTASLTVPQGVHIFNISQRLVNTSTTTITTITRRSIGLCLTNPSTGNTPFVQHNFETANASTIPIGGNLVTTASFTIESASSRTYFLGSSTIGSGGTTTNNIILQSVRIS